MKTILDEARVVIERTGEDTFKISCPDIPNFIKEQTHTIYIKDTMTVLLSNVIVENLEDEDERGENGNRTTKTKCQG